MYLKAWHGRVEVGNCSLNHYSCVSLQQFWFWLPCASERAPHEDTWHRLVGADWAAVEYIREGGLSGSIHHRTKGNCASAGAPQQERPIAQPLSQQCITGISHVSHRTRIKTDVDKLCKQSQQTDGWITATDQHSSFVIWHCSDSALLIIILEFMFYSIEIISVFKQKFLQCIRIRW